MLQMCIRRPLKLQQLECAVEYHLTVSSCSLHSREFLNPTQQKCNPPLRDAVYGPGYAGSNN